MSQDLRIALTHLTELAELELLTPACPDPPPGFHRQLKQDVKITRQFLAELRGPVEPFFVTGPSRKTTRKI